MIMFVCIYHAVKFPKNINAKQVGKKGGVTLPKRVGFFN